MAAIDEANLTVPMMKLELVPVPVADVDRAKAFYEKAGFLVGTDNRPSGSLALCDGIATPSVIAHRTNTAWEDILGGGS